MPRFSNAFALTAILLCALGFGAFQLGSSQLSTVSAQNIPGQNDASKPDFYATRVKPIFDANCSRCHLNGNHRGGLNMDTRDAMLKGGRDGSVLVPGDPGKSLLVQLIRHEGPADDPMPMPPAKPKISDADIATVTQWVKAGATMPAN